MTNPPLNRFNLLTEIAEEAFAQELSTEKGKPLLKAIHQDPATKQAYRQWIEGKLGFPQFLSLLEEFTLQLPSIDSDQQDPLLNS